MFDREEIDGFFQVFFEHVRLLVDIPPEDQALCRQYFAPIRVSKGTLLELAGKVHVYHNFIVSGYMRCYHIDDSGQEVTTDLNDGPRFFTSYHAFANRTPSNDNLQCLTDCELLRIKRDDVDITARLGTTQIDYTVQVLENALQKNKQRVIDMTTRSAEDRYRGLMNDHPAIIQHVPLKYIASYLGINPGSLSRIRNKMS